MKLRLIPLIISIVVSSIVLFGGWFVYDSVAVQTPLTSMVKELPGVQHVKIDLTKNEAFVELELNAEADLNSIMSKLYNHSSLKNRKIQLTINSDQTSSAALDRWWSTMLFDIAEAMEHKQYSDIPKTLASRQHELAGAAYEEAMDESNVYIKLTHKDAYRYIVLPRESRMGVWPL